MKYAFLVKEEAIQDMTEAFDWYENKKIGLGTEFLDEVDDFFGRITQNPEHYQLQRNQRITVMHRFPYKIAYEIEEQTIVVYAVYHNKRDPAKLMERE